MAEARNFASLKPTLLARKGSAKPAMRPQLAPLHQFHEATAFQVEDLGWNDMGLNDMGSAGNDELDDANEAFDEEPVHRAEIVQLNTNAQVEAHVPEVLRQRKSAAASVARLDHPRRSALSDGRRAAFTLRLDGDRHLNLRLACTVSNRSAQQIVTEALDKLLEEMPEVAALADQVRKRG